MMFRRAVVSALARSVSPRLIATAFAASILGVSTLAHAAYPEKPITLIISFPPAGATDVMARAVGQALSTELGQSVVVENRAGAGGMIGLGAAARAPADGYTLHLSAVTNQAIADALYANKPADLTTDFIPVAGVGYAPHALVVPASLPVKNVAELVTYLKASPDKYNFSSQVAGTLSHLESELFALKTGVKLQHIPYKGSSQALPEVVTGTSSMMWDSITGSLPLVQAGRLKMLAVGSTQRVASLPDVPTAEEAGVPGFAANNLFGIVAPECTLAQAVQTLEAALKKVLASPELIKKVASAGSDLTFIPASKFGEDIKAERATWAKVVKDAQVSIQ